MDLLNGKLFELKLDEYKGATQSMEKNFIRVSLFKMIDDYADAKVKEFSSKQDVIKSVCIHKFNIMDSKGFRCKCGERQKLF